MKLVEDPEVYPRGKIPALDVIEDWKLNFNLGSTVYYIALACYTDSYVGMLKKAAGYLNREIERCSRDA